MSKGEIALADGEAEAAFVALMQMFDGLGCCPAATIAAKDDGGVSFSLHFGAQRARKLIAALRQASQKGNERG